VLACPCPDKAATRLPACLDNAPSVRVGRKKLTTELVSPLAASAPYIAVGKLSVKGLQLSGLRGARR
jgi:hypothetical protein